MSGVDFSLDHDLRTIRATVSRFVRSELLPLEKDGISAPYNLHQLIRVYILAGEKEKAMDALEKLLKVPYFLSPSWLRVDPTFDPLRGNARFDALTK